MDLEDGEEVVEEGVAGKIIHQHYTDLCPLSYVDFGLYPLFALDIFFGRKETDMSCIMPRQSPERISHYRQKASDARSCAEQMQEGKDRDTMLDVASTWERLADLEETALPLA